MFWVLRFLRIWLVVCCDSDSINVNCFCGRCRICWLWLLL